MRRPAAAVGEFGSDDSGRCAIMLHGDEVRGFDSSRQRHCVRIEDCGRTGSDWLVVCSEDERLTQALALLWRTVWRRWEAEVSFDAARVAQSRSQLLALTSACDALFQAIEAVDVSLLMGDEWEMGEEIARLTAAAVEAATGIYALCVPVILYASRLKLERRRAMFGSDRCHGPLALPADASLRKGEADVVVRPVEGNVGSLPCPNTPSRALGAWCSSTGCASTWGDHRWRFGNAWLQREGDQSDVWGPLLPCGRLGLRRRFWWFMPSAVWNAQMRAIRGSGFCGCGR